MARWSLVAVLIAAGTLTVAGVASARSRGTAVGPQAGAHRHSKLGAGFAGPMWTADIGSSVQFSSPTFATIEGVRAVVAASLSGDVYALNAITGKELSHFPVQAIVKAGHPGTAIDSSPTVAYLDGPSQPPTIIVGTGSKSVSNQNGGAVAIWAGGADVGKVRWVVNTLPLHQSGVNSPYDDEVFATPAVGDIQGTGEQDVVFGGFDHRIYAVTPNGHNVSGFPIVRDDATWASAILVDSSHAGRDDIIVGTSASGGFVGSNGKPCDGGWVLDYRYSTAARGPKLIWGQCVRQSVWSSAAIGVINTTNRPAIVVGESFDAEHPAALPYSNLIYAFYADNGSPVPGWPVIAKHPSGTYGATFGSPVIGQVTPGGPPVIISSSCAACLKGPGIVSEWNGAGHLLWTKDFSTHYEALASPAVVNLTGSGDNDVLVGGSSGVYMLDAANGDPISSIGTAPLQDGCRVFDTPAFSPVSGAGAPASNWELAFDCQRPNAPATLVAYGLPVAPDQSPANGQWRANELHNGVPDPPSGVRTSCSAPATVDGYRVIRADGAVLPFGSLTQCGGLSTESLPGTVIGAASTSDGGGYWLAMSDGKVYSFGNAVWRGDALTARWVGPSVPPGAPTVGFAAASNGDGYYLLDGEGHVYGFGSGAPYAGSAIRYTGNPVGILTNPAGAGYWVVTSTGDVQSFGGVPKFTALSDVTAVVSAASTPDGKGLWLLSSNGTIHTVGSAVSFGSPRGTPLTPMVSLLAAPGGTGYWMVESNGTVDAFPFPPGLKNYGSATGQPEPIVAITAP
ncbi:MAG: hypothetical protein ABSD78_00890 [Acidimicrobiales bacterium]